MLISEKIPSAQVDDGFAGDKSESRDGTVHGWSSAFFSIPLQVDRITGWGWYFETFNVANPT